MSADFLARAYSIFVAYLAEPAARSLVIGCAAAAALAAFRVRRVGTRLLAWIAVLCAALAMPFLGAVLPHVPVKVPAIPLVADLQATMNRAPVRDPQRQTSISDSIPAAARYSAVGTDALAAFPSASRIKLASTNRIASVPRKKEHRSDATNVAFALAAAPRPVPAEKPATSLPRSDSRGFVFAIPWTALLVGIYLLGVAILLARLIVGTWFSRRLERAAESIEASDDQGREALRLLRFRSCIAGLAQPPRLRESALLAVPATLGILRSAILLPAGWRSWSEEQLDAVIAHEISHVARRDALAQFLSLVHRAIFWFSPLSWWLDRQLTDLAEQASDEAALAGGADRTRYAETLLAFFAQLAASRRRVWWQGVAMAKHDRRKTGSAERRVSRILEWKGAVSMKRSFVVAVIALAVPLIFFAASVHPFIAHAQDAPKPPAPPQNVILPGGPVAPKLPNAPKGGVKGGVNAPALPPAPNSGVPGAVNGGVIAPALPPAPKGGVNGEIVAPALSNAPTAGIVAPPALSGSERQIQPTPPTITAPVPHAPYAPYASITPVAPPTPQSASDSALQDLETQMATAQKALQDAEAQFGPESKEAHDARQQMASARQALMKARHLFMEQRAAQLQEVRAAMVEAKRNLQEAQAAQKEAARNISIINGSYSTYSGGRYVIMSGPNESVEMSGDDEDFHHAQELRKKLGKDLIWFERDEKSYVITDPDFIAKAKALFAPEDALSKQQDELSRQQDALSKQQDALSEKMDSVKVKVPDIAPDIQRIQTQLDALSKRDGATQSELGRLQSELGQLQSQVGRFQSDAGVQQSDIGRQQGELGRQQGELGRKQGELGRQQGELARAASRQLRQMLDDAIAKGIAKPE